MERGKGNKNSGHAGGKRKFDNQGKEKKKEKEKEYSCEYDKYYFGENKVLEKPSEEELKELRGLITEKWFDDICEKVKSTYITENGEPQIKLSEPIIPKDMVLKILNVGIKMLSQEPNILPSHLRPNKDFRLPKNKNINKLVVVGDMHGTFDSLKHIIKTEGFPSPDKKQKVKYVFNGDYVDRGAFSVEVFLCCLAMHILNPECVCMLRGNHESEETSSYYTLAGEIELKYGMCLNDDDDNSGVSNNNVDEDGNKKPELFMKFCETFRMLPIACIIDKEVLVLHGGIPARPGSSIQTIEKLCRNRDPFKLPEDLESEEQKGKEKEEKEKEKEICITADNVMDVKELLGKLMGEQVDMESCDPLQDVLWSDPTEDHSEISFNYQRNASIFYGKKAVTKFLDLSNRRDADRLKKQGITDEKPLLLRSIIRSHSCVPGGYLVQHNGFTTTIFSVPKYQNGVYEGEDEKGAYIIFVREEKSDKSNNSNQGKLLRTHVKFMVCPNAYLDNQPIDLMCNPNMILRIISEDLNEDEFYEEEEEEEEKKKEQKQEEKKEQAKKEEKEEKKKNEDPVSKTCDDGTEVIMGNITNKEPVFKLKYVEAYNESSKEIKKITISDKVDIPILLVLIHDKCIDDNKKYWQYCLPGRRPSNRIPPVNISAINELIKTASDKIECVEIKKRLCFGMDSFEEDGFENYDDDDDDDDWDEDDDDEGEEEDIKEDRTKSVSAPSKKRTPK